MLPVWLTEKSVKNLEFLSLFTFFSPDLVSDFKIRIKNLNPKPGNGSKYLKNVIPTESKTIFASIIKITYLVISVNNRCFARFQIFRRGVDAICSLSFRNFTQRRRIVCYRRFGTIYQSCLFGFLYRWSWDRLVVPKIRFKKKNSTVCKIRK